MKNQKKNLNLLKARTKEWDTNDWQGRSQRQVEDNHRIMGIALTGLFLVLIGLIIYGIIS